MKINQINDYVLLAGKDRLELWNKSSTSKSIAKVTKEAKGHETDSEVMKVIAWCEMNIVFYKYGFVSVYDKNWKQLVQKRLVPDGFVYICPSFIPSDVHNGISNAEFLAYGSDMMRYKILINLSNGQLSISISDRSRFSKDEMIKSGANCILKPERNKDTLKVRGSRTEYICELMCEVNSDDFVLAR